MSTPVRARLAAGILGWLAILSCGVRADSLLVGERQWPNVKIQWFQDGKVRFTAADGTQQAVPIPTVTRLQVDLRDDLNRAERLRADGKTADAAAAYEVALRTENRNDLGGFIRYRLMDLCGRAGQLDRAVEMFLDLVKQPDFYTVVNGWRPTNVATVKPKLREAAVTALEDELRQIKTGLASESVRQLRDFIQAAKPAPAGEVVEVVRPATPTPPATGAAAPGAVGAASPAEAGAGAEAFAPEPYEAGPALKALQAGRYADALRVANEALAQQDMLREQLAEAVYVRGVAQWQLAKDPVHFLQAGWALSRLVVEFPTDSHVPECLYCLGLVHQRLGQAAAARQLLQQAQQAAGVSADLRDRARKALQEMGNNG